MLEKYFRPGDLRKELPTVVKSCEFCGKEFLILEMFEKEVEDAVTCGRYECLLQLGTESVGHFGSRYLYHRTHYAIEHILKDRRLKARMSFGEKPKIHLSEDVTTSTGGWYTFVFKRKDLEDNLNIFPVLYVPEAEYLLHRLRRYVEEPEYPHLVDAFRLAWETEWVCFEDIDLDLYLNHIILFRRVRHHMLYGNKAPAYVIIRIDKAKRICNTVRKEFNVPCYIKETPRSPSRIIRRPMIKEIYKGKEIEHGI